MTKKTHFAGTLLAVGSLLLGSMVPQFAAAAAPGQPGNATPAPKILVIDQSMVLRASKVGQDIVRQVNAYTAQAENDLKGQATALRQQYQTLQQQLAILSADVKARKIKDFQAKQAGLQAQAQKKQGLIQGGFIKARQQVVKALDPILHGIMAQRGANLLLDRNAVVMGTLDQFDITRAAVQQLDQKLPSVKVELVAPPPGMQQPQQQQQP